jgi:protein-tyrosine phosphatase
VDALSRLNFRDVGGLPAAGGQVRAGVLYRSEGPASFLAEHRLELGALGFRTVCDLRSAVERDVAPNDWCGPDCRLLALDMNTDLRAQGEDIWASLRAAPDAANARRVMAKNYGLMPAALRPHWPAIVDAILDGAVPMLVHCTAGKDRTGVAIALLLLLLGVPEAAIRADYGRSDVFAQNAHLAGSVEHSFQKNFGFTPSAETIAAIVGVHDSFLSTALAELDAGWGSIAAYFEASGVGRARQDALRAALTV